MKIKNFIFVLAAMVLPLASQAQSYAEMWKRVDVASAKDLPKSALSEVRKIYERARKRGDCGQQLKAAVTAVQMQAQVSEDSIEVEISRADSAAQAEKRPVERAMWLLALAEMKEAAAEARGDSALANAAIAMAGEATRDLSIFHGRKAAEFSPIISTGSDSKYFGGDLLNAVVRHAEELLQGVWRSSYTSGQLAAKRRDIWHRAIAEYSGNADAAVLLSMDSLRAEASNGSICAAGDTLRADFAAARALAWKYRLSQCAVEAYIYMCEQLCRDNQPVLDIFMRLAHEGVTLYPGNPRTAELRNMIKEACAPSISADISKGAVYPGEKVKVSLRNENSKQVKIELRRLPLTAEQLEMRRNDFTPAELSKYPSFTLYEKSVDEKREAFIRQDTAEVAMPAEPGIYILKSNLSERLVSRYNAVNVSRVKLLFFNLPDSRMRITAVDAQSGKPLRGAKIKQYDNRGSQPKVVQTYTTAADGTLILSRGRGYFTYGAELGSDKFSPVTGSSMGGTLQPMKENERTEHRLYLDRKVYRPGQKVKVGGVVFRHKGDEFSTIYDSKVRLALRSSHDSRIIVDSATVRSDELGAFSAELTLPTSLLTGTYYITASGTYAATLRVEEYKRPTFEVSIDKPEGKYSLGDTVSLMGSVKAYSGFALTGAKVEYEVKRMRYFWWRQEAADESSYRDTTATDAAGKFTLRIPLTYEEQKSGRRIYRYEISVSATSSAGETQTASTLLAAGDKDAVVSHNIPDLIDHGKIPNVKISLLNLSGSEIHKAAKLKIYRDGKLLSVHDFTTCQQLPQQIFSALPSGNYVAHTSIEGVTDTIYDIKYKFSVFSFSDKRPVAGSDKAIWLYTSSDEFPVDGGKVRILLGTPLRGVTAFYDVIAGGKLVESRQISLSDELETLSYEYREEYGPGVAFHFAFVRDGELYARYVSVAKVRPDKRLRYKWTSFRDRLRPSQREEWSLSVLNADGSPASASAVCAIYDASLDKFAKNEWPSSIYIDRYVPKSFWDALSAPEELRDSRRVKLEKSVSLTYDRISLPSIYEGIAERTKTSGRRRYLPMAREEIMANDNVALGVAPVMMAKSAIKSSVKFSGAAAQADEAKAAEPEQPKARENFAETAYFAPALLTDGQGRLRIAFTTPESLTKWHVKVFAHTREMNVCEADTTATVSKELMIQPNMPRFLREGDQATLMATVRNLSSAAISGRAVMTILDASNMCEIASVSAAFSAPRGGETTVSFPLTVPQDGRTPLLICKMTADGGDFTDGEQHYIPVLSRRVEVVSVLPFTLHGQTSREIALGDSLTGGPSHDPDARIRVEYTSNPAWLAVEALPMIHNPKYDNAVSLVDAYFATVLEARIADLSPEIRDVAARWASEQSADTLLENALERNADVKNVILAETPWQPDVRRISQSRRALAEAFSVSAATVKTSNFVQRLSRLQNADGGFSWFSGMRSSYFMTEYVAITLLRLETLTGHSYSRSIVTRALAYLDSENAARIRQIRELERKSGKKARLGTSAVNYLNILRMYGRGVSKQGEANCSFYIQRLVRDFPSFEMQAKSLAAMALYDAGRKQEALSAVRSVVEHTVVDPDKGRYFDSFRSPSFRRSYRIPTQVAAIDALRMITPSDQSTINEMLTWLLQSMRTQSWDTMVNTVDVVYALLSGSKSDSSLISFRTQLPQSVSLSLSGGGNLDLAQSADTADADASGYIRADLQVGDLQGVPQKLKIAGAAAAISWGAVYGSRLAEADDAGQGGRELTVRRAYYLMDGDHAREISAGTKIGVGQMVRVRYEISASRDYDYVALVDARPACLEPVEQMSGYRWSEDLPYYLAVRDASNAYFIESLPKGKHVITCDFRADRAGTYLAAPATVSCLYSPEFSGRAVGRQLSVEISEP